jgi:hypothetical protein
MRLHTRALLFSCALSLGLLPAAAGGSAGEGAAILEPSAPFSLGARLISVSDQGSSRRAVVELTLFARRDLSGLRIQRKSDTGDTVASVPIPAGKDRLRARVARQIRIPLDLEDGRVHHLRFTAEGAARSGKMQRSSAYIRLNLDPSKAPERLRVPEDPEDLIQYRARTGGR